MNTEQFREFLTAFQAGQKQIVEKLSALAVAPTTTSEQQVSIANIHPFENFDQNKEKFKSYIERFENYISMKGITIKSGTSASLLLHSIGSNHYNMLTAMCMPKQVKEFTYVELVEALTKLLSPKRSMVVSQHYFLNTVQKENQSIADYIGVLQQDLIECEFTAACKCGKAISVAENFLRIQFIRGLYDNSIREKILQTRKTSFKDIVNEAMALEATKLECLELTSKQSNQDRNKGTSIDINKIKQVIHAPRIGSRNLKSRSHEQNFSNGNLRPKVHVRNFRQSRTAANSRTPNNFKRSPRSKNTFKDLGIENLCLRCGRNNHFANECRCDPNTLVCTSCQKVGHVQRVCIMTLRKQKQEFNVSNVHFAEEYDSEYDVNQLQIVDLYTNKVSFVDAHKYYVTVKIEGHSQKFEIDSGAGATFIPKTKYENLHLTHIQLRKPTKVFRSYTGSIFTAYGCATVKVQYKNKTSVEELYVVPDRFEPILGRIWIRHLQISLQQADADAQCLQNIVPSVGISLVQSCDAIFNEFSSIFEPKIGCIPNFEVKLQLRNGAKPAFLRERDVPYALRERVNQELNALESSGIISPIAICDWGSPLVVIPKTDNGVRLCVDYKSTVNPKLISANYPIRRIEDVLHSLRDSKYFCKLDLYKAYLHIKVDEESSRIQTISTHRGTFKMHRLSFGIKTAPSEFNRIIANILQNLPKAESYFDDIIIHGSTYEECYHNLHTCLKRLSQYDLHLNKSKCLFFTEKVSYLGHIIGFNKISKDPEKIRAITDMQRPRNIEELRRFLGMLTFYSKFIPNYSTISYPLRRLLYKNQRYQWTPQCESTFIKLKSEICSDRVLIPFNPKLQIALTTDASPTGIAAILSHEIDGQEKPILYASRSLTGAEQHYSQLDREALAIIFGVRHCYKYLFGRHFTLITDNKPLTHIFHQNSALPKMTSMRLLRYASFLSGFDYTVKFKNATENQNVDCISRAPLSDTGSLTQAEVQFNYQIHNVCAETINTITATELNSDKLKQETQKDAELGAVMQQLQETSVDCEYTIEHGVLFRGTRLVIPKILQVPILKELHQTHIGITKMKQLARRYVYWKNIDKDIERYVKSCESCALSRTDPPRIYTHPWETPIRNWERVHIDYAGPFQGYHYLICVDAKSRWIEIKYIQQAPTSNITMELLNNIFSTHGYPEVIVSDNATIFTSEEFVRFCKNRGIFQKFIAPGNPSTNGLAERNVQTLKKRLVALCNDTTPMRYKIQEILFRYRATPLQCDKTPAELYLGRRIRIKLDALRPHKETSQRSIFSLSHPIRHLQAGERVQARVYQQNQLWKFGTILRCLGKLHYIVQLDDGYTLKRHINQLRSTFVPQKKFLCAAEKPLRPIVHELPYAHHDTAPEVSEGGTIENVHAPQSAPDPVTQPLIRQSTRNRRPPAYLNDYETS